MIKKRKALREANSLHPEFKKNYRDSYKRAAKKHQMSKDITDDVMKDLRDSNRELYKSEIRSGNTKNRKNDIENKIHKSAKENSKFGRFSGRFNNLERGNFKYYVTHYSGYPIYEPAEGGYYYEGREAVSSKGFDSKQEAIDYINDYIADEGEYGSWKPFGNNCYVSRGDYIGDSEYIELETNRHYMKDESGRQVYESLLFENRFSGGKHIDYNLSVFLRNVIEEGDYDATRIALKLAYKQINIIIPNIFSKDDVKDAEEEIDSLSTDYHDYVYDEDDPDDDPEENMQDEWNGVIQDFFDTCDALGIWVCTEGDKYKDEDDEIGTDIPDFEDEQPVEGEE